VRVIGTFGGQCGWCLAPFWPFQHRNIQLCFNSNYQEPKTLGHHSWKRVPSVLYSWKQERFSLFASQVSIFRWNRGRLSVKLSKGSSPKVVKKEIIWKNNFNYDPIAKVNYIGSIWRVDFYRIISDID
jgi:hypothetical protein